MTEFSNIYKEGIDCLQIPDYTTEELGSLKRHKKYIKRKKFERFAAAMFFIFIFSILASATAYATYAIHKKNIQFTSYGVKVDFSGQEAQSDQIYHDYADPDILVTYTDIYKAPASKKEDFTDAPDMEMHNFDNWTDALEVIDFPVAYPKNIQYSGLEIATYQTAAFKLVEAIYTSPKKVIDINYTYYYLNSNWSCAIDYNAQIIDKIVYTNKYNYDFMISECLYGDFQKTNVMAYVNDYTIELSFHGYETNEIYDVLEEFDLSVYE